MWQQIESNKNKTVVFVILMSVLFIVFLITISLALFEDPFIGIIIGVLIWIFFLFYTWSSGDSLFLNSVDAKKISKSDLPVLFDVVEEMQIAAGLKKMPDIYLIDDPCPNAFATGRSPEKSSVAVTSGLLVKLNREELQGVIAHEMAHIVNRDTLLMLFLGTILGVIVIIANSLLRSRAGSRVKVKGQGAIVVLVFYLLLLILAPICSRLIYFAVSRKREYLADACAAQFTRYPMGLANALMKISECDEPMESVDDVVAAMCIINPKSIDRSTMKLKDLTATHPSTRERIKILSSMANVSFEDYEIAFKSVTHKSKSPVSAKTVFTSSAILAASPVISTNIPVADKPDVTIKKYRKTEDLLWKYNDYTFVNCDCGTTLKVPPDRKGETIACPHCQKSHLVS